MTKFGFPDTLLRAFDHWVVLLRPAQVTLGSLVLAAKSDAAVFSDLPAEAFAELALAVRSIETALSTFCDYERINYLMLMMVDPNVHFHVFPRYSAPRLWGGRQFPDEGWPGQPQLKLAIELTSIEIKSLVEQLKPHFYS